MEKLTKLIEQLCPDGVEYKMLGDIANISRGGSFQKKDFVEEGVPCIHYGQIYTKYGLSTNETFTYISDQVAKKQKYAHPNDIVMAVTSENIEDVCKCVAWLGNTSVAVSGHSAIIHHNQNTKYLAYYFHSSMFFTQKRKIAQGTKVIEVSPNKLNKISIPVPPIEVQAEIVRILDKFTELTAELTTELTTELANRKKQYEYYRHRILSIHSDKELALEEIFYIRNGYTPSKKNPEYWENGDIQWFRLEDIRQNGRILTRAIKQINSKGVKKSGVIKKNSIMMSTTATLGEHALVCVDYLSNQQITNFTIKEAYQEYLLPKFAYYCFFELGKSLSAIANYSGGIPIVDQNKLKKLTLPIPPIEEQRRIVAILDRFEKLCNDISEGLPAEIEARQKQYEYYRDKLLTFTMKE